VQVADERVSANPRKILICVQKGCTKCDLIRHEVPEESEYRILHLLETSPNGIVWKPRQSGKTTELVAMANKMAETGYPVYYLTFNLDMAHHVQKMYGLSKSVKAISKHQLARGHLRGLAPGFLITDEVGPSEMDELQGEVYCHHFVGGYYS